jgi:uncharacterized protein YecT (DUF1311 family)
MAHHVLKARALALGASLTLVGAGVLNATPALADPVGECQTVTANQVNTNQCLQNTLSAAQHVLDLALMRAQEKAASLDAVTGRDEAVPSLDQSQSDWETFVASNCALRGALAAGASGSGTFIAGCAIEMTRLRAAELDAVATGA